MLPIVLQNTAEVWNHFVLIITNVWRIFHKFKDIEMQRKPKQDGDEDEYVELTREVHAMGRFKDDK